MMILPFSATVRPPLETTRTRASNFSAPLMPKASPFSPRTLSVSFSTVPLVAFCGVIKLATKLIWPGRLAARLTTIT